MKLELRDNKDFWAGLMFIVTGGIAVIESMNYAFGTIRRMGPGFLPTLIGGILIVFGIHLVARGLRNQEKMRGNWSLRALVMLPLAMVSFGLLMKYAGFVPALTAAILLAAASGKELKIVEALLIALFMNIFAIGVFIWGLGLPFTLIKGF
jgi:hypothetical protein